MRTFQVLGAVVVGAALWCPAANAGPVQILGENRGVTATARPGAGADPVVENVTAADAGTFVATAAADASGDGFVSRATSSVTSRLGSDGLHFAGTLSWETQDTRAPGSADSATAVAAVVGGVTFRLDEPYDFEFSLVSRVIENSTSGAELAEGINVVVLDGGSDSIFPGDSGTLRPGEYLLQFNRSTESTVSGDALDRSTLEYELDLNLTPSDGSSEPNPIPLPPAAWAGLGTMGLVGLGRLTRRLPRRA